MLLARNVWRRDGSGRFHRRLVGHPGCQRRLGRPVLRQFRPVHTGVVLLFPAEDALAVVRQRLADICAAADVSFDGLAVDVITAPSLRLDLPADRQRPEQTAAERRPRLLVLDPLIRLHRIDENDASQVAPLLSFLRELQRRYLVAVIVVHHARKDAHGIRPGQALRGSSELHGWGDSNLYLLATRTRSPFPPNTALRLRAIRSHSR